ncbi:TPA: hypothetical protein ACH3KG_000580 [Legionella pneumophila]
MNALSLIRQMAEKPELNEFIQGIKEGNLTAEHVKLFCQATAQVGVEATRGLWDTNVEQNDFSNDKNREAIYLASLLHGAHNIGHINNFLHNKNIGISDRSKEAIIGQMEDHSPIGSRRDLAWEKEIATGFLHDAINKFQEGRAKNAAKKGSGDKDFHDGVVDMVGFVMHSLFGVGKAMGRGFLDSRERFSNSAQSNEPTINEHGQLINERLASTPQEPYAQNIGSSKSSIGVSPQLNSTTQNSTIPNEIRKFVTGGLPFKNDDQQVVDNTIEDLKTEVISAFELHNMVQNLPTSKSEQGIEAFKVEQEPSRSDDITNYFRSEFKQIRLNGRDQQPKRDEIAAHNPGEDNESDIFTSIRFPR